MYKLRLCHCNVYSCQPVERFVQELTSQRTIQSYVCPCIKAFDQYAFFLLSVEIQADQSHFQEAGASDKPNKKKIVKI